MGRRGRSRVRREGGPQPEAEAAPTPTSGRYTPPVKPYRLRPDWHKPLGWVIVAFGVLVAVVNDLAVFDIDVIPGEHSELYLLLAFVIAGGGTWFLGLFDPPA
jgi:hypothetical protein